jgi:DNA-binding NarL/FixJ family response regulator
MNQEYLAQNGEGNGEIRVTVADPKKLNLEALMALLKLNGIRIVGSTSDPGDVPAVVRDTMPDVLLIDAKMSIQVADETWARFKSQYPRMKTLLVADPETAARLAALAPPEVRGMIQRNQKADDLLLALRTVASGRMWDMPIRRPIQKTRGRKMSPLSPRERDIAMLITQGYSNREIAQRLELSEQSVKNIVSRILRKHGFRNRTQIALWRLASGGDEEA